MIHRAGRINMFFMRLREKLIRFMYGRYGSDELNKFLMWVYIALAVISLILSFFTSTFIIQLVLYALFFYTFYRMLSKKIYVRQAENRRFLEIKSKALKYFNYRKNKWKYRKTHVYKKCPSCKVRVRFPRKKGEHTVVCPKCRHSFHVNIR